MARLNRELQEIGIKARYLAPVHPNAVTETGYWFDYPANRRKSLKNRTFHNWLEH